MITRVEILFLDMTTKVYTNEKFQLEIETCEGFFIITEKKPTYRNDYWYPTQTIKSICVQR